MWLYTTILSDPGGGKGESSLSLLATSIII
jgi:hypothetical protein